MEEQLCMNKVYVLRLLFILLPHQSGKGFAMAIIPWWIYETLQNTIVTKLFRRAFLFQIDLANFL